MLVADGAGRQARRSCLVVKDQLTMARRVPPKPSHVGEGLGSDAVFADQTELGGIVDQPGDPLQQQAVMRQATVGGEQAGLLVQLALEF